MKSSFIKNIKLSFKKTIPVMAGYVFLGITFGLVCKNAGFAWWIPILMSIFIYSGALEFAAVPLFSLSFNPISAFILGITLSARHLFYGLPMLKKYENTGKAKPFLIFGLTDETFSILSSTESAEEINMKQFYFFVTLFDFFYWVAGTAAGALLGSTININLQGLDFALTALFVVLFIEQIKTKTGLKSGVIGLVASLTAYIIFGSKNFVIISMLFIVICLVLRKKVLDNE